jgi:hypothetical protein
MIQLEKAKSNVDTQQAITEEAKRTGMALTDVNGNLITIAGSAAGVVSTFSSMAASAEKAAAAIDKAATAAKNAKAVNTPGTPESNASNANNKAAEDKRLGRDSEGFTANKDGSRLSMGTELGTRTGVMNFLKAAGVDDEEVARKLTAEFTDERGNIPYFSNPGQVKYGGSASTMSEALLKAAETYTFSDQRKKKKPQLATGTNYIPYDGFQAELHEGEAVIPKQYNPEAGGISKEAAQLKMWMYKLQEAGGDSKSSNVKEVVEAYSKQVNKNLASPQSVMSSASSTMTNKGGVQSVAQVTGGAGKGYDRMVKVDLTLKGAMVQVEVSAQKEDALLKMLSSLKDRS